MQKLNYSLHINKVIMDAPLFDECILGIADERVHGLTSRLRVLFVAFLAIFFLHAVLDASIRFLHSLRASDSSTTTWASVACIWNEQAALRTTACARYGYRVIRISLWKLFKPPKQTSWYRESSSVYLIFFKRETSAFIESNSGYRYWGHQFTRQV